jgi:hypothetical protein
MSDAMCTKYGCDYQLDLDGQVTCSNCGAMDDDMLPRRTYNESDLQPMLEAWKIDPYTQELLSRLGSDFDENGIPYWDKERGDK